MLTHIARRALIAGGCAVALALTLAGPASADDDRDRGGTAGVPDRGERFDRVATLPVYLNSSITEQTAAEIAAATKDGRTVVYTDSPGERIGFVDLRDVARPRPAGTLAMPGEPTSVAILGNDRALVAVNTSESFTNPSGRLVVVDLRSRTIVAERDLGGQPDSIAISGDGRYAAVAIENERDEDVNDGEIPQLPAGFLAIVDLRGEPATWPVRRVELTGLADVAPTDPEPEYVAINGRNQAVVTLQENNHLAFVDLATGRVTGDFSAGDGTANGVDVVEDGTIRLDGSVTVPREPDAVAWLDDRFLATADEGDLAGGSRTWTIFDSRDGRVVFSSGGSLDQLAARYGQYPEGRAENKGVEPEGVAVATYGREKYVFVGMERANLVAVYRLGRDVTKPELVQAVPTGVGPEGLLPLPQRDALLVSAEEDVAEDNVRSSVSTYALTRRPLSVALDRNAAAPSIVSALTPPAGFGAVSGLDAVPGQRDTVVAIEDDAYTPTRVLTVDTRERPAVITRALPLTKDGAPVGYDAEGIAARDGGGYWVAAEGNGAARPNLLVEVDARGVVLREIPLPPEVAAGATSNGFEGVTTVGADVWVAIQRTWRGDAPNTTKLARYSPATGQWTFVAYPLDPPPAGATVGLSEITTVDADTLLLIERDNRRGLDATIKKVTRVELAGVTPVPFGTPLPLVAKRTELDLIPALRAGGGVVADKPEGLTITGRGDLVGVVDNDGLDNAPGESVLLRLGRAPRR